MKTNKDEIEFALESSRAKGAKEEEIPEIAKDYLHTKKNIIPPVGIAHPDLIRSFEENISDENKIKEDINELERYHKESKYETGKREVLSHGARFLEGLGGTVSGLLNILSGEAYFDERGEMLPPGKVKLAPSSGELRELIKSKTGKYLEPKNEISKNTQEFTTDVGSGSIIPGLSALGKVLIPMAGQSLKSLVKNQGGTEAQGDIAKLSLMGVATLANIGNAPQYARRAYNEAINMVPQGTIISANPTIQAFQRLKQQPWFKTGRTTSKGPAMDELARIEASIQNGTIDAHTAMQLRRDINEARNELGAFNYKPGIDKKQARRYLDEVDRALTESLTQYGNRHAPDWLKNYTRANEAYRVTSSSRKLSDFISSHPMTKPLQSQTAKTLFHLGGASALSQMPALVTSALPVVAGIKSIQIINRMIRSPALRTYYVQVLSQAALGNVGAMQNALERFDKVAAKMEGSHKSSKQSSGNKRDQAKEETYHPINK